MTTYIHTSQLYTQNTLVKKYNKNYYKTQSQNKLDYKQKPVQNKNQLELKYKFLNDGTVAASEIFDGKLFPNTAPR